MESTSDYNRTEMDALIKRCQAGEDAAFDELVEQTKREAFALAYRLTRDRELSMDMVQEGYLKLYRFLPKWNYSCRVQTWLYRVVTNACIDQQRRDRFRPLPLYAAAAESRPAEAGNPRDHLQSKESHRMLEACLTRLPERMQQAFRLKYMGGLSLQEISEVQGCSIGTIKASIHQAGKRLRKELVALAQGGLS